MLNLVLHHACDQIEPCDQPGVDTSYYQKRKEVAQLHEVGLFACTVGMKQLRNRVFAVGREPQIRLRGVKDKDDKRESFLIHEQRPLRLRLLGFLEEPCES